MFESDFLRNETYGVSLRVVSEGLGVQIMPRCPVGKAETLSQDQPTHHLDKQLPGKIIFDRQ